MHRSLLDVSLIGVGINTITVQSTGLPARWWRAALAPAETGDDPPRWADFIDTALSGDRTAEPTAPAPDATPSSGTALFGPVISRLPSDEEALELWDHVIALSQFPGFAELKRSLRERIQLPAFGVPAEKEPVQEDWHGGSRRLKK